MDKSIQYLEKADFSWENKLKSENPGKDRYL